MPVARLYASHGERYKIAASRRFSATNHDCVKPLVFGKGSDNAALSIESVKPLVLYASPDNDAWSIEIVKPLVQLVQPQLWPRLDP